MACGALSAACRRYQWDVQVTVLRVAASMRERSFRVWVDSNPQQNPQHSETAHLPRGGRVLLFKRGELSDLRCSANAQTPVSDSSNVQASIGPYR